MENRSTEVHDTTNPTDDLIMHLTPGMAMEERGRAATEQARQADQEHIDAGTIYEPPPDTSEDIIRLYLKSRK